MTRPSTLATVITIVVLLFLASSARAIDTAKAFDDPELQARYEHIIS